MIYLPESPNEIVTLSEISPFGLFTEIHGAVDDSESAKPRIFATTRTLRVGLNAFVRSGRPDGVEAMDLKERVWIWVRVSEQRAKKENEIRNFRERERECVCWDWEREGIWSFGFVLMIFFIYLCLRSSRWRNFGVSKFGLTGAPYLSRSF